MEIDLNAAANARNLYANRKANLVKQQKTLDANERAFKAAEKKATLQLNKVTVYLSSAHLALLWKLCTRLMLPSCMTPFRVHCRDACVVGPPLLLIQKGGETQNGSITWTHAHRHTDVCKMIERLTGSIPVKSDV